jgi:hypothetical protein
VRLPCGILVRQLSDYCIVVHWFDSCNDWERKQYQGFVKTDNRLEWAENIALYFFGVLMILGIVIICHK